MERKEGFFSSGRKNPSIERGEEWKGGLSSFVAREGKGNVLGLKKETC